MAKRAIALDDEVKAVLGAAAIEGDILYLPQEQLPRPLYIRVDKALKAVGAKWSRKAGGHELVHPDAHERLSGALATGEAIPEDTFGYFPTPPVLVDRLLELAEIEPHHSVLEPSAGQGAVSNRLLDYVPDSQIQLVELQERHAGVLRRFHKNVTVGDFMSVDLGRFDRIIMNPPFERLQDIDHVTRAFGILGPGGRMVAVMAAGATEGQRRKCVAFRELVERSGRIETNPDGLFQGTNVRTVTVTLTKPKGEVR